MPKLRSIFGFRSRQIPACLRTAPRLWIVAILGLASIEFGCGDQFRPVAQPIPLPTPNPSAVHFVAALSTNGSLDPGATSRIDVSGDSLSSVFTTGVAPTHATFLPNGTKVYVANTGEDTVSSSNSTNPTSPTLINLPQLCDATGCALSEPVFVHTAENGKMYVANSGNGTVSVINAVSDVVVRDVSVDPAFNTVNGPLPDRAADPIALAEMPNASKVYAVNRGNSTVTSISTIDDSVASVIHIGSPPLWAVASPDSAHIYVLDTSGTISVIDTLSDLVVSTSASAGAGANFMFYDSILNRLYATNPANSTVSIFDASTGLLVPSGGGPLPIAVAAGSVCTSPALPMSVTVLGDGSRAYVASIQTDPGSICSQVTIIDNGTGAIASTIAVSQAQDNSPQTGCSSARFRASITSSGGGTNSNFKVYVSQCDAGTTSIIDTFAVNSGPDPHGADVLMGAVSAPLSSFPPPHGQVLPPFQNPVFVVAGP